MSARPVACIFRQATKTFEVIQRHHNIVCELYTDGETYMMEEREERSSASHAYYFAAVNEAWANLPDDQKQQLPSAEHLRKWALIKAGYYNETLMACENKAQAVAWAQWLRRRDDYSEIAAVYIQGDDGNYHWYFRLREAKSQSRQNMNKQEFEASKRDVLDILAGAIEVRRRDLEQAARSAT